MTKVCVSKRRELSGIPHLCGSRDKTTTHLPNSATPLSPRWPHHLTPGPFNAASHARFYWGKGGRRSSDRLSAMQEARNAMATLASSVVSAFHFCFLDVDTSCLFHARYRHNVEKIASPCSCVWEGQASPEAPKRFDLWCDAARRGGEHCLIDIEHVARFEEEQRMRR